MMMIVIMIMIVYELHAFRPLRSVYRHAVVELCLHSYGVCLHNKGGIDREKKGERKREQYHQHDRK